MGFRKILKKWDKRSRSSTKELYLSRQVEVQPVFNRQVRPDLDLDAAHSYVRCSSSRSWRIRSLPVCWT